MRLGFGFAACLQGFGNKILNNSGTTQFLFAREFIDGIHELSGKRNSGGWGATRSWSTYPLLWD
jgi:hypothetical protein